MEHVTEDSADDALVLLDAPEIDNPEQNHDEWDYDTSVSIVQSKAVTWRDIQTELLEELLRAKNALSKPGNPYRKTENGVVKKLTWEDYLSEVGLVRRTVNRWLKKYLEPEEPDTETEEVDDKPTDEDGVDETERTGKRGRLIRLKHLGDNDYVARIGCPDCDHEWDVPFDILGDLD